MYILLDKFAGDIMWIYCKTGNFRVQENFAIFAKIGRFAKFSCSWIFPDQSRGRKLSVGFYRIKIGPVEVSFLVLQSYHVSKSFGCMYDTLSWSLLVSCSWEVRPLLTGLGVQSHLALEDANNPSWTCTYINSLHPEKKSTTNPNTSCHRLNIGPIFNPKPPLESCEPLLFENSRNFPVANLPTPRIREIFLFYSSYLERCI